MAHRDGWAWVAFVAGGIVTWIGSVIAAHEAGQEYGKRELIKQLREKDLLKPQQKENTHDR